MQQRDLKIQQEQRMTEYMQRVKETELKLQEVLKENRELQDKHCADRFELQEQVRV